MSLPIHIIVEFAGFTMQAGKLGVTSEELAVLYDIYSKNPEYGAVVKRTGGLRKGRIAKHDTGKSGGYRVFSFFTNTRFPVYLLWIIDKTKDATLSDAQEATFKRLTTELKRECR